jgi:hypothetical protein
MARGRREEPDAAGFSVQVQFHAEFRKNFSTTTTNVVKVTLDENHSPKAMQKVMFM